MTAGYSRRSLIDTLGIKSADPIQILYIPSSYYSLLGQLPKEVIVDSFVPYDFMHVFTTKKEELEKEFPKFF